MNDFLDEAIFPPALADNGASERKGHAAAIAGLADLDWIKAAAARGAGALVQGHGRFVALAACLTGVAWLGWSHVQSRAPGPQSAEISRPAQTTAGEPAVQAADAAAMRAAQSLNAAQATVPETAKPRLEAAKTEANVRVADDAGKPSPLPPKPAEKLDKGGEKIDRVGLEIAALLAAAPASDHSASATPATRKRGPRARHDAFDPSLHPNAPGAPRPLGAIRSTAPAKKTSAEYAYRQPAE